jgi:hypothetical protein
LKCLLPVVKVKLSKLDVENFEQVICVKCRKSE